VEDFPGFEVQRTPRPLLAGFIAAEDQTALASAGKDHYFFHEDLLEV
jgi:hypothetical protein